jgi:hypothetical protein
MLHLHKCDVTTYILCHYQPNIVLSACMSQYSEIIVLIISLKKTFRKTYTFASLLFKKYFSSVVLQQIYKNMMRQFLVSCS